MKKSTNDMSARMLLWHKALVGAFMEKGYIYEREVSIGGFGTIYKCHKGKHSYAVKLQ
jgi:hypothetical protein